MSTDLRQAAADYLRLRRSLGYRLIDHDWLIAQFLDHVKARGNTRITVADALTFAQAPATTSRRWHAQRLAVIRGLAVHVRATDSRAAEVIPPDLIHGRLSRRIPYLYSPEQVRALMTGARTLRPPTLAASVSTLVGLMAVTGMRTCEARCLDVQDLAIDRQVLAVTGKYGKRRLYHYISAPCNNCSPTCGFATAWRPRPTQGRCWSAAMPRRPAEQEHHPDGVPPDR